MSELQTQPIEQKEISVDDRRLESAQAVRHDIVNALTTDQAGNKAIPTDKDSVYMILTALKDSDSSIYKKKRLVVDEVNAESDRMAAETMNKMFGADVARRQPAGSAPGAPVAPRAVGEQLPDFNVAQTVTEPLGTPVDINSIKSEGRRIFKGQAEESTDGGQ